MPQKKEELSMNVNIEQQNGGTITYANEVIAIIAGIAANEIEGIAGMCISGGFGDIIGRNRNITRGVKVELGSEEVSIDLFIIVEYGQPIQKVSKEVQENVKKALESMTGLHVVRVDVHVQGVSFEKEKKQNQNLLEEAKRPALTESTEAKKDNEGKKKTSSAEKGKSAGKKKESAKETAQSSEKPADDPLIVETETKTEPDKQTEETPNAQPIEGELTDSSNEKEKNEHKSSGRTKQ